MILKRIYLEDNNKDVFLDAYIADALEGFKRNAILVIPGGGYGGLAAEREGEPVALAFTACGYNAFVLHYTVGRKKVFPAQLIEASLAMKHIRDNAEEYGIDPAKVFTAGFSAGGHLAGSLGIMWNKAEIYKAIDMEYGYNKPAGMMLVYPVVTGVKPYMDKETFANLLGDDEPAAELLGQCSLEVQVHSESCPLFLVHTSNDGDVDVRNSLCLAERYRECGLQFEMHIYPDAPHGVALGNRITRCNVEKWENPAIAKWVEHAADWAETVC